MLRLKLLKSFNAAVPYPPGFNIATTILTVPEITWLLLQLILKPRVIEQSINLPVDANPSKICQVG